MAILVCLVCILWSLFIDNQFIVIIALSVVRSGFTNYSIEGSSCSVILNEFVYHTLTLISSIFFNQILQQMKSDIALLTLENGGSPIQNPSTAAEDARLASLISLDSILKQIKVFILLFKSIFES